MFYRKLFNIINEEEWQESEKIEVYTKKAKEIIKDDSIIIPNCTIGNILYNSSHLLVTVLQKEKCTTNNNIFIEFYHKGLGKGNLYYHKDTIVPVLREDNMKTYIVIDTFADPIICTDENGEILHFDSREKAYEYSKELLCGMIVLYEG